MAAQASGGIEVDRATPNLPARDFAATARFYAALGFTESYRGEGWMILERGALTLEFFPHPDLDPAASWFSCCLRLDDLDAFFAACEAAGIAQAPSGFPRLHAPSEQSGLRIGALIDADGSLLRLIQNPR
jgi:catechol 2,3-dioxygenase-like lactoylglutathione lyase family enzyme